MSSVRAGSPVYRELEPEDPRSGSASVDWPEPQALISTEALNNSNSFDSVLLLIMLMIASPNLVFSRRDCFKIVTLLRPHAVSSGIGENLF